MVWWDYPHEVLAVLPPLVPVDLSIIPCSMMLVYQFFKSWKAYLTGLVSLALFSTFVGEQLFILADFFQRITWKPYYSILFFLIAGIFSKCFVTLIAPKNRS